MGDGYEMTFTVSAQPLVFRRGDYVTAPGYPRWRVVRVDSTHITARRCWWQPFEAFRCAWEDFVQWPWADRRERNEAIDRLIAAASAPVKGDAP